MAEYIEREKIKNILESKAEMSIGTPKEVFYNASRMLDFIPPADVVKVVRCKDCEHQRKIWHKDNRMKEKGYYSYSCDRNSDPFVCHTVNGEDNDFCSYGKRKEGAD